MMKVIAIIIIIIIIIIMIKRSKLPRLAGRHNIHANTRKTNPLKHGREMEFRLL